MERKKILYVVEAMGGGIFTYIVDLANAVVQDHDVYIAYAIRPQTPPDYEEYFDKRINLINVKHFTRSISLRKDLGAFFEIKQIAKEVRPDIIHLHSSKAGVLGRMAFNGNKVQLFYTPHGYSFLMSNYSVVKRAIYAMIENIMAKRKCVTISCSEGEHKESLQLTENATYVNNGINTTELMNVTDEFKNHSHERFDVFTLGRICNQKNPTLFNKIAESLPNIKFLWIGDGELRDELRAPNITITGWVTRKEALEYSMSAKVFILTSLWEGLPMSLLEAMFMKKLCVVSDVIGNHDVICNGVNGYVCKDTDQFIKILNSMNEIKWNDIANRAHRDVINLYSTAVMAEKYKNLYNQALEGKKI